MSIYNIRGQVQAERRKPSRTGFWVPPTKLDQSEARPMQVKIRQTNQRPGFRRAQTRQASQRGV